MINRGLAKISPIPLATTSKKRFKSIDYFIAISTKLEITYSTSSFVRPMQRKSNLVMVLVVSIRIIYDIKNLLL